MNYTSKVISCLNKDFGTNIKSNYHSKVERWRRYWEGRASYIKSKNGKGCGKRRKVFAMNMPKKITEDWASFLLNEETTITLVEKEAQDFVDDVLLDINFSTEGNRLVEKAFYSGTGTFVLKVLNVVVDEYGVPRADDTTRIACDFLSARCIVPISTEYGKITEAAFYSVSIQKGNKVINLEVHTRDGEGNYVVQNKQYKLDEKRNIVFDDDAPVTIWHTLSKQPMFHIIMPNIENPYENNMGMGCAIYAQALDMIDATDIAYNNLVKDFELGGKKVFYNKKLVGKDEDGNNIAPDDAMQQLFYGYNDDDIQPGKTALLTEFNPSLRVSDGIDGIQALINYLSWRCGMGADRYKFDGTRSVSITATQYVGEKQDLKQNASKHGKIINEALEGFIRSILFLANTIFGKNFDMAQEIKIDVPDGYIRSDDEKKLEAMNEIAHGILQPWEYREKFYGEEEEEAKKNVNMNTSVSAIDSVNLSDGEDV